MITIQDWATDWIASNVPRAAAQRPLDIVNAANESMVIPSVRYVFELLASEDNTA
jgi:hypothetical protein